MKAQTSLRTSECWHSRIREHGIAALSDRSTRTSFVILKGALRAPDCSELVDVIRPIIRRGDRRVLLDLARLTDIDAAGIGELVRAFTAMRGAGGVLRITRATGHVRRALELAGVLEVLAGSDDRLVTAAARMNVVPSGL